MLCFSIFHETTHINPYIFEWKKYYTLMKDLMNAFTLLETKESDYVKNVEESHCDFTAMAIMQFTDIWEATSEHDSNLLYDMCLKTIIALEFFTFISEIEIDNFVGFNESAQIIKRLTLMHTFVSAMKCYTEVYDNIDADSKFNDNIRLFYDLIDNTSALFGNLSQEIDKFNEMKNLDKKIEDWKNLLDKEDKETWIFVE